MWAKLTDDSTSGEMSGDDHVGFVLPCVTPLVVYVNGGNAGEYGVIGGEGPGGPSTQKQLSTHRHKVTITTGYAQVIFLGPSEKNTLA